MTAIAGLRFQALLRERPFTGANRSLDRKRATDAFGSIWGVRERQLSGGKPSVSAFRRSVRRAVRLKSTQLRRSSSLIGRPKAGVRRVRLARFCGCPGQLCGRRVIESACGRPEDSRYAALRILIHRLSLLRNQCGHCAYGSNLSLTITHASSHRLCVGWCRSQSVSRVARLPSLIGRPPRKSPRS